MFKPAILALKDGIIFRGRAFCADGERAAEVVFNTSMMGYPEILTDPSYAGQMVCMTYPLIGNYGIAREDFESRGVFLSGLIIKEKSRIASNRRSNESLDDLLKRFNVPGIEGIDTRRLVRHIRRAGAMTGVLSTTCSDAAALVEKAKSASSIEGRDCVSEVTSKKPFKWTELLPNDRLESLSHMPVKPEFKVVALDFGIKYNILRSLVSHGCDVTVVPAKTSATDVLALEPDGVFLSNGPGDPAALPEIVSQVRKIAEKKPVFGICLGHQILALAFGARTYKLKFGHHGGNHPVMQFSTGQVEITSQNHGFAVDPDSIMEHSILPTHINLNDNTLEGMAHTKLPVFSVQYHPEAAPGPHDSAYLFKNFITMMRTGKPIIEKQSDIRFDTVA